MPKADPVISGLETILADTYALYLKTQNYHWNVTGPTFYSLHLFFEEQYQALAEAVDLLAERLRALGSKAPGSFQAFYQLTRIPEAQAKTSEDMIRDLTEGHTLVIESLSEGLQHAKKQADDATQDLLIERLRYHQKIVWMLKAHHPS